MLVFCDSIRNSSHHFCKYLVEFIKNPLRYLSRYIAIVDDLIEQLHSYISRLFFSLFYANSILISLWSIFFNDVFICTKNSLAFYVPNFNCFFFFSLNNNKRQIPFVFRTIVVNFKWIKTFLIFLILFITIQVLHIYGVARPFHRRLLSVCYVWLL